MAEEKLSDRLVTVVITLVVAGILGVIGTALARGALIGALGGVQESDPPFEKRIEALTGQVAALQAELEAATGVPTGAVIAFDLPGACPEGWEAFGDAAGRAIVGAGAGTLDAAGEPLTSRNYREHGGKERHALTLAELPAHSHGRDLEYWYHGGPRVVLFDEDQPGAPDQKNGFRKARFGSAGEGQAHETMSPFIALYYCKKT